MTTIKMKFLNDGLNSINNLITDLRVCIYCLRRHILLINLFLPVHFHTQPVCTITIHNKLPI